MFLIDSRTLTRLDIYPPDTASIPGLLFRAQIDEALFRTLLGLVKVTCLKQVKGFIYSLQF